MSIKVLKPIHLIKRILLYILLIGISLLGLFFGAISGGREYGDEYILICMYLISQYIFGLIFFKTKLTYIFIVPFVTAIVSFVSFWQIGKTLFTNIIDSDVLFFVLLFFPIIFVWEIAYQILKIKNTEELETEEENIWK